MFYHFIVSIGTTIIITQSFLFEEIRNRISSNSNFFGELINCPMCLGLWVGLFYGLFYNCEILPLALGSSLFSWLISAIGNLIVVMGYYYDNGDEIEQEK